MKTENTMKDNKFITKAKRVHGDKYDYSKVEYTNSQVKVCIICPEHGEFWQTPAKHIHGQGCPRCAHPNSNLTVDEFVEKADNIHGGKYIYRDIAFTKLNDKINIICKIHGAFTQTVKEHLNGQGCPKCRYVVVGEKKRMPLADFIKRANDIHGDKYDYSKVDYVNYSTPVCIVCPEHGEFRQMPSVHLGGSGCPMCVNKHRYTTEEWVEAAKKIHIDKYNYSKVVYKNNQTKVRITCPEHGEFWQMPSVHLGGSGCPKCGRVLCSDKLSMGFEIFFMKSKEIHGDKYDYTRVEYINNTTPVCIICPEHGEFRQMPSVHLNGSGCPKCALEKNRERGINNKSDFIEKARKIHGDKYDYSKVDYVNSKTKVCIVCPQHGEFWMEPSNHLSGQKCKACSKQSYVEKVSIPFSEMVKRANDVHENRYIYHEDTYTKYDTKMKITCQKHGEFWQTPNDHVNQGHGCPNCSCNTSTGEKEIQDFIGRYFTIVKKDKKTLDGLELDILVPSVNMAVEYNGLRWHSEEFIGDRNYHLNKTEKCKKLGIGLVHVFEDEYLTKKEIVLDKLKTLLHVNTEKKKIGARKTYVREITKEEAKSFLDKNHIQGFARSTMYYGAFSKTDELVGVMTFKVETKQSTNWELTRFATDIRYSLPGLGSKMFKYFVLDKKPTEVKSFADRRWTVDEKNNLYTKMGFRLDKVMKPDYHYVVKNRRTHKFNMRKTILHKKYNLPLSMTEKEMCDSLGFYRIWDCGLYRFVWKTGQQTIYI